MVEHRTCNAKVGGSIPPGGKFCRDSITVSIPACHAGDRGSIPRRGASNLKQKMSHVKVGSQQELILKEIAFESRMRPSGFDLYSKFIQRLLYTIFIAVNLLWSYSVVVITIGFDPIDPRSNRGRTYPTGVV